MPRNPRVTIIVPCRNEEAHIERLLLSILSQDMPSGSFEVLVVDGRSDDGTLKEARRIAEADGRIRILDNPMGIVASALNTGIRNANGEIVVRMDAHCEYPEDYVRQLVALLQTQDCDNIGGVLVPVGSTPIQKSIGAAYQTPIGTGVALRSHSDDGRIREVDAVWGGCWWREKLLEIGLFDESFVRNQDDELCFRLRKSGGRVLQSPSIRVKYHVRSSFRQLLQQYLQYGFWKFVLINKHPTQSRPRHYMPALFVASILLLSAAAIFHELAVAILALAIVVYFLSILLFASIQARKVGWSLLAGIMTALAVMHLGYGSGFICGMVNHIIGRPPGSAFQRLTR